jgi:hypothetical protein
MSSLIDRTLSRSIGLMHYDWLDVRSIRVIHLDRSDQLSILWSYHDRSPVRWNFHCVKFGWSNSITINQTNALGLIGCSIDQSNTLGSIRSSINPMILSWSIRLVLRINRLLDGTFIVSSLNDRTLSRSIRQMHYIWLDVWSIRVIHLDRSIFLSILWSYHDQSEKYLRSIAC